MRNAGGGAGPFPNGGHGFALSDVTHSVEFERGGFWRRALALLVDTLIVTVILQLLAFALYPLSQGRVQFVSGFALLYCDKLDAVPEGVSVPADFGATSITDCRRGIFGLTSARVVTVARVTRNGAITTTRQIDHLLDAQGKPTGGPTLDALTWLLVFAMRFAFDRSRRSTPGRRICRVRLSNAADGQSPPPSSAVNRRYAAQMLPLLPLLIWSLTEKSIPGGETVASAWLSVGLILPGVVLVIAVGLALNGMIYRRDTWYDRYAGTSVLRLDKNHAIIPLSPAPERVMVDEFGVAIALPPPLPKPQSQNYFLRHWRGELSLPKSYWLNGTVFGLVVGAALGMLMWAGIPRIGERPIFWLTVMILARVFALLFQIWQAVGVWRSATRYKASGHSFWGGAAKTAISLGLAYVAYSSVFVTGPQFIGIYDIATGDALVGPHQFRVVADGKVLEFSGGISFGVAKEFETLLGAMGNVTTVRLNSIGGRILEAQKMSDMISARGLSTDVMQSCLSACTIVFLGGKERLLFDGARLGFHQPAFRGMTTLERGVMIGQEEARLQHFGLSRAFAERANAATPNGMWFPDKDELLREKVVTRIVMPQPTMPPPMPTAPKPPAANTAATPLAKVSPFPTPGAPVELETGTYQTMRVPLPADLVKRLSKPKPPQPAGTGTAAATGGQK